MLDQSLCMFIHWPVFTPGKALNDTSNLFDLKKNKKMSFKIYFYVFYLTTFKTKSFNWSQVRKNVNVTIIVFKCRPWSDVCAHQMQKAAAGDSWRGVWVKVKERYSRHACSNLQLYAIRYGALAALCGLTDISNINLISICEITKLYVG